MGSPVPSPARRAAATPETHSEAANTGAAASPVGPFTGSGSIRRGPRLQKPRRLFSRAKPCHFAIVRLVLCGVGRPQNNVLPLGWLDDLRQVLAVIG